MTFHVYQWIWYSRKTCASTVLWTGTTSLWARISSWVSPSPTLGARQGPSAPRCCVRPCSTLGCGTESWNSNPTSSRCPPDQVSYFTLILFITSFLVVLFSLFSISIKVTYMYTYRIKARIFTPQIDAQITGFFVYSRKNKGLIITYSLLI